MSYTLSSSVPQLLGDSIISAIVNRIFSTRIISRTDQKLLMEMLNKTLLSEADVALINRIYIALHDGLLRVVD